MNIIAKITKMPETLHFYMHHNPDYVRRRAITDLALITARVRTRLANFDTPKQGDVVEMDGRIARIAHVWEWDDGKWFQPGHGLGCCHLSDSGLMSYSGAMDPTLPLSGLQPAGFTTAPAWIFSANERTAHNGTECIVRVRKWTYINPSKS